MSQNNNVIEQNIAEHSTTNPKKLPYTFPEPIPTVKKRISGADNLCYNNRFATLA